MQWKLDVTGVDTPIRKIIYKTPSEIILRVRKSRETKGDVSGKELATVADVEVAVI